MPNENNQYMDKLDYAAENIQKMKAEEKAAAEAKAASGETTEDPAAENKTPTTNAAEAETPEVEQIYKARPSVPVPEDTGDSIPPEGIKALIDAVLRRGF